MTSMLASVAELWLAGRPDQVILIYVLPGSHRVPQLVVPQGHPGPSIRQALGTMILATFAPTMWREYSHFHPSLSNGEGWRSIRKPRTLPKVSPAEGGLATSQASLPCLAAAPRQARGPSAPGSGTGFRIDHHPPLLDNEG